MPLVVALDASSVDVPLTATVVERVNGPTGAFVAGSSVALRLVASLNGEAAGLDPATLRTYQGKDEERLRDELWVRSLRVNAGISPTNNVWERTTRVPGRGGVPETFVVPVPTVAVTSAPVDLAALSSIEAPTAGFRVATATAPKLLSLGGRIFSYTGASGSAFTGVALVRGTATGTIATGSTVTQAFWVGELLDDPPAGLPSLAIDAEAAVRAAAISALDAGTLHKTGTETKTGDFHLWTRNTHYSVPGAPTGADYNDKLAATLTQAGLAALTAGGAEVQLGAVDEELDAGIVIPHRVHFLGAGADRTRLRNRSTGGGSFIAHHGSGSTIAGFTADGRRVANSDAGVTLQTVKPSALTGSGLTVSGGLVLTAPASAGATSLNVVSGTLPGSIPVMPGDLVSIVDPTVVGGVVTAYANWELVRVARTYAGGTVIPLEAPLLYARATTAAVSVASCDFSFEDVHVYGQGIGMSLWHTIDSVMRNCKGFDTLDTLFDFEGGTRNIEVVSCFAESWARFQYGVDAYSLAYGIPGDITFRGCHGRILNGAPSNPNPLAQDGFYIGVCEDVSVVDGVIDLRRAGNTGIRRDAQGAQRFAVDGLGVAGPETIRAGTYGYVSFHHNATPALNYGAIVRGMKARNLQRGIDFALDREGRATNCLISNVSEYGLSMTAMVGGGSVAQRLDSAQNDIDGCVAGVRAGGTPVAGSSLNSSGDSVRNASFGAVATDPGWTVHQWP